MGIKRMNKKAIFFTLLAVAILFLFLASYSYYTLAQNRKVIISKRVKTMNNLVYFLEEDLEKKIYITSFRILFIFQKDIIETGEYLTDLNGSFQEVFFNGTLDDENVTLIENLTFYDIRKALNSQANKINVNISMSNTSVFLFQDDPWNVKVGFKTNLIIRDLKNSSLWNKTYTRNVEIPITSFEDPIYIVKTNSLSTNQINKTIYKPFVKGSDVSNLSNHAEDSYYINSTLAPSYLDRLKGDLSASSENGIESIVNLPKLSSQGLNVENKSVVDYIYFSSNNPSTKRISGMPDWFKLDVAHLSVYNVTNLAY